MRFVGILIILNTAIVAVYLLTSTSTDIKRITALGALGLVLGIGLIIADRVTHLKVGRIAEIDAATARAFAGADQIEQIQKEVEAHKDQIALIFRDANDAHQRLEQITKAQDDSSKRNRELAALQDKANAQLDSLAQLSELYNFLLAIHSDDRKAFDQIRQIAFSESDPRKNLAMQALRDLPKEVEIVNLLEYPVDWKGSGIDPATATLADLIKAYNACLPVFQTKIMDTIWQNNNIPKSDRIEFVVAVLKTTPSMRCLDHACRILGPESGLQVNFVYWPQYVDWWNSKQTSK
jgi:biopolymer transport protein ExbB/TolQ